MLPAMWFLWLTALLAAQPAPEARELLEKAAITAAAAQPEMHALAMMYLGGAWQKLDKKQSAGCLRQAFAAAGALPDAGRAARIQAEIVKSAARVDVQEACELLRAMPGTDRPEARTEAAERVVEELIARRDFDKAVEVLALTPASAAYPFDAALRLFKALPKDDSRRVIVFGNAATAYRRAPGDAFRTMLAKHWKAVPREMAQTALAAVVNDIRGREEEPGTGESIETPKGTLKLGSRKAMDLFDLLPVLRALDPIRAKELLEQYPDLGAAAKLYPDGRQSVGHAMQTVQRPNQTSSSYSSDEFDAMPSISMFDGNDFAKMQEGIRAFTAAVRKAGEAWAAFEKDRPRALSLADEVAVPTIRAELYLRFARAMESGEFHSKCDTLISDIPDARDRIAPLLSLAELEHKRKNGKGAWDALERAMAGVLEAYRSDTDGEHPNRAPRVFWPSTLGCRGVVWQAAKLFSARTEALFAGLPADLLLLAQIELAATLLGDSDFDAEHRSFSMLVEH